MGWVMKGSSTKHGQWEGDCNLVNLLTFAAVVSTHSCSKAGRSDNIQQPTISTRIWQLENATGLTLFQKVGKSEMHLTDDGRAYIERALNLLDQAMNEIEDARQKLQLARNNSVQQQKDHNIGKIDDPQ
ncbi:LysR family transcriptional regulator [Prosthecomicrobium sp. N25]|uniref:LysR family transcriptional regulator n=1 Tax=Prosthecomicrobium sp. N25 TaxID=3129254 RepID=UPI003077AF6F